MNMNTLKNGKFSRKVIKVIELFKFEQNTKMQGSGYNRYRYLWRI